jgi:hypothetical protein
MTLTAMTREGRRAQLRDMTPEQNKAAYTQLLIDRGYIKKDLGNGIVCLVNPHYLPYFNAGLYDTTTHLWHPSVKNAAQAVICVSA